MAQAQAKGLPLACSAFGLKVLLLTRANYQHKEKPQLQPKALGQDQDYVLTRAKLTKQLLHYRNLLEAG